MYYVAIWLDRRLHLHFVQLVAAELERLARFAAAVVGDTVACDARLEAVKDIVRVAARLEREVVTRQ